MGTLCWSPRCPAWRALSTKHSCHGISFPLPHWGLPLGPGVWGLGTGIWGLRSGAWYLESGYWNLGIWGPGVWDLGIWESGTWDLGPGVLDLEFGSPDVVSA